MDLLDRLAVTIGATRPDDRAELVARDLLDTARRASLACVALVIEHGPLTANDWLAVAADFRHAKVARGSHVPGLYAAHEAAEKLAANDLEGALALLADSCGLPVEEWVRITRAEQGR